MKILAVIALALLATGPEPIKKPGPISMPSVVTGCMNSKCRCTRTVSGCLNCISTWCDAVWDTDEDRLYNWWCRNKSRKGC